MKLKVVQPGSPHDVGDIVEFDEVPQYLVNKVELVKEPERKLEVATPKRSPKAAEKGA